jgi:hypothetical protein
MQDQQVVLVVDDALPNGRELADNVNVRSGRTRGFYPSLAECDDPQQVRLFLFNDEDLGTVSKVLLLFLIVTLLTFSTCALPLES